MSIVIIFTQEDQGFFPPLIVEKFSSSNKTTFFIITDLLFQKIGLIFKLYNTTKTAGLSII